jgi:hypothetical protein
MMPAPPMGERPERHLYLASAALPPRQTGAVSLSCHNGRATFRVRLRCVRIVRAALALCWRHGEARRRNCLPKHLVQGDADAELNGGCRKASGRSAFGNAGSRRQGMSDW